MNSSIISQLIVKPKQELMSVFQNIDQVIKNYSFEKSEDILNQYFETLDGKSAFRITEYLNDYSRKSEFSTLF